MGTTSIQNDTPMSLKEWREAETITMVQAAKRLRITESYYSKLENGKRRPSVTMAKKLSEKTQVPILALLGAA